MTHIMVGSLEKWPMHLCLWDPRCYRVVCQSELVSNGLQRCAMDCSAMKKSARVCACV